MTSLICYLLIFTTVVQAQAPSDPQKNQQIWQEKFEHQNQGCPINSDCSKELGLQRKKWLDFLEKGRNLKAADLEAWRQRSGIPVQFWLPAQLKNERVIVYDSECGHHWKKNVPQVVLGEVFAQGVDLKKGLKVVAPDKKIEYLRLGEQISLDTIYILEGDRVLEFLVSKGDIPLAYEKKHLLFAKEYSGHYYHLRASVDGDWQMIAQMPQIAATEEVNCPTQLQDKIKQLELKPSVYQSHFCKQLYDVSSKKFVTMLVRWAC